MKDKEKIVKVAKSRKIEEANVEKNNDLRNKIIIGIVGIIGLVLVCFGINHVLKNTEVKSDSVKFKEEYEKLNYTKVENTEYTYLELLLPDQNPMKYSNYDEIFEILENGSGVIYFGFPECPWCRALTPILINASENVGIDKIYYLNNKEDRDLLELDDKNNVVEKKKGSANYYKLLEKLGDYASDYDLEGADTNKKRLYFPTVLFVKDGKIVDFHEGTSEEQENPFVEMNDEEKEKISKVLQEKMEKVIVCNGTC